MNIMVFDVPAESGGALSILNDFYDDAISYGDNNINWIFIVSKPKLKKTENIKVLRFPWIKKGWLHRFYFDNIIAPNLIKKYKVDKVISFQNVIIPRTKIKQVLYVHQSLPFVDYKFTFKENKKFWIYQNIIGKKIINSIRKADKVIVQTRWMKEACEKISGVNNRKIDVVPPQINIKNISFFEPSESSLSTFFYPAGSSFYKNHRVVVEACNKLKETGLENFKVIFTLKGNENNHISQLYREVRENNLPIDFLGSLTREQVFNLYTKSILIFPSYIETFGLPMYEARLHNGIVLAADCPSSHEVLDGYENAYFFNPFHEEELVVLVRDIKKNELVYKKPKKNVTLSRIEEESRTIQLIEEVVRC
jgi:glycosyltransferase involved in cell wall biosynthesis